VTRSIDLSDVPVIDGHGHPLVPDPSAVSAETFANLFSEGRAGSMTAHVPHTVYFRRACRDLARRLGTEPTPEAVLEERRRRGPAAAARALAESRVAGLLVDTGYPPEAMTLAEMRRVLPCAIHEVFRIETCAQDLLREALAFDDYMEAARAAFRAGAERSVGLKSIIAYRSGLAVQPLERGPAARAYERVVRRVQTGGSSRLEEKPLLDALFGLALEVARESGRPLQIHSGFGDPDIDLLQANPLLLRPILEGARGRGVRLVLLHQSYPYVREAAFMTAVWPQVHLDLSLALPFLGPGALLPLIELLSLAPATKLLYGSDVSALPELFALCADWARATLGEALAWLVERDGLTADEGREVGRRILWENAVSLYGLTV
jgi:predicted TIM-barrel fold metal-dependent hydrolase